MAKPTIKRSVSVVKLGGAYAPAPIEMFVTGDEVGITMTLDAFITALVAKVGNPTLLLTRAQLQARLTAASVEIVTDMKTETISIA